MKWEKQLFKWSYNSSINFVVVDAMTKDEIVAHRNMLKNVKVFFDAFDALHDSIEIEISFTSPDLYHFWLNKHLIQRGIQLLDSCIIAKVKIETEASR